MRTEAGPEPALLGLLEPGARAGYAVAGDAAVVAALVRAEMAWARVLADAGRAPAELTGRLDVGLRERPLGAEAVAALAGAAADGGNPVIPLVAELRDRAGEGPVARFVHRGLTSQDVLDTGLMLVAADVLDEVAADLRRTGTALAALAQEHRGTVAVGRTLTQHAVPVTVGLRVAQWLTSVEEVLTEVEQSRAGLPVQCGGAAGTMAGQQVAASTRIDGSDRADDVTDDSPAVDAAQLADRWADALGLARSGLPWHTRRRPVTRLGDTLAAVVSALGHLGTDVATLSRPEIGEVAETLGDGQGGSSTMPHKRNPVRAVLLRAAGIQAGPLAGTLHQCAALAVDERPDGSWHAEWPTLQRLLVLAVTTAGQAAELAEGLVVRTDAVTHRVAEVGGTLLSEWHGLGRDLDGAPPVPDDATPGDYLGHAHDLTDAAVRRWQERTHR